MLQRLEKSPVLMPSDTRHTVIEDVHLLVRGKEHFAIMNRTLEEVDMYFNGNLSKTIGNVIESNPNRRIRVLDVGAGTNSVCIQQLIEKFDNKIDGFSVDIAHNVEADVTSKRIFADVRQLPLADASIQIAYSSQVFPFLDRLTRQHEASVYQGIAEIARVLAPGGIALIDDEEELSGPRVEEKRNRLAEKLNVILEPGDSANLKYFREVPKFWQRQNRNEKYLIIKKAKNV